MKRLTAVSALAFGIIGVAVLAAPQPIVPAAEPGRSSVRWEIYKFPSDPAKRALVSGSFKRFQVTALRADGTRLAAIHSPADITGARAVLDVEVASLDSGVELRDDRLRHVLFDVARFPQVRFDLKHFVIAQEKTKPTWETGDQIDVSVDGDLTIRGVTKPLKAVPLRATVEEGGILVQSTEPVAIAPQAFGLPVPDLEKVCGHAIDQNANVHLQLFFKRGS